MAVVQNPTGNQSLIKHETKVTKELLHQNKTLVILDLQLLYNGLYSISNELFIPSYSEAARCKYCTCYMPDYIQIKSFELQFDTIVILTLQIQY